MSGRVSCKDGSWVKPPIFKFKELQEAAAAHTGFTTSKAESDTPVYTFSTEIVPDNVKTGTVLRIHIRLNWANAVTLEAFRIYSAAKAGDYESSSCKLYESIADFPAGLVDDDEYDITVEIPFYLDTEGTLYYALQWSAGSGNIQGYADVEGRT